MDNNDAAETSALYADAKKNNRTNLWICIIIIVGFTLYYAFAGNTDIVLDFGEESMTVTDSSEGIDFSIELDYDDINEVYVADEEELQLGELITGYEGKKLLFGEWSSGTFGTVSIYAEPDLTEFIVITTDDLVFAMNIESDETTEAFYEALLEMFDEYNVSYETR